MMARRHLRLCLAAALGFIPLAVKMPYIVQAYLNSPLDRPGLAFGILFLLAAAVATPKVLARAAGWDLSALLALLPALAVILAGMAKDIHAVTIVGAITFAWAALWLALGWRSAYCIAPAFAILMLMTTSLRYWLGYFSGPLCLDGIVIMAAIAVVAGTWLAANLLWETTPSRELFCFSGIVGAVLLAVAVHELSGMHATSPPFIPDISRASLDNYLGSELPATEADRRFYGDNDIEKYFFTDDVSIIHVLAVHCGDDVHQIHPTSHCLRTGGWDVLDEKSQHVSINSNNLVVNEIVAAQNMQQTLFWVWYSNDEQSTASFLNFRRLWTPSRPWASFLLQTGLDDGLDAARQRLHDLLAAASKNPKMTWAPRQHRAKP
ncbi:MAG TPA: exosortase-associated EpsI family protein [Lentisphaeria bacterium]|nr:exosortase-associated EpsI family protein [Lentisphaerota bacterium]OQC16131.1 MAG: hypothetical protein BWX73_00974 [Lentisphaerae bacterium ADurb.Bin082]HQC52347.1 exosortase-associated EpsI family protein [Lentisphaeria bacterium]HQL86350.1 exosortase-associated EpsI family protein [Lentisphaeria bacterium]